jgi:haloalkane dehalogenase
LSDKPSEEDYEYSLETHIDNLESLLIALDLKNITLVLHDWGGAIGMGFACRYPNRIKSLVIFNSSAFSFNWMPLRISMCRIPAFGRFCVRNLNLFSRLALTMAVRKPLSAKVKKGYLYPYQNYEDRVAIERFIDDIPMSPVHKSYEVLLQIEHGLWMFRATPACFIWGMRDWCFNSRFLERWALFYPQAHIYTLNNSGHYLLEDNPQKITFHMKTFFKNYKI